MELEDSFEQDFNAKLEDGSPYEVRSAESPLSMHELPVLHVVLRGHGSMLCKACQAFSIVGATNARGSADIALLCDTGCKGAGAAA